MFPHAYLTGNPRVNAAFGYCQLLKTVKIFFCILWRQRKYSFEDSEKYSFIFFCILPEYSPPLRLRLGWLCHRIAISGAIKKHNEFYVLRIWNDIGFYAPRVCALQSDSLASLYVGREENDDFTIKLVAPCSEMISLFYHMHKFTALTHPHNTRVTI